MKKQDLKIEMTVIPHRFRSSKNLKWSSQKEKLIGKKCELLSLSLRLKYVLIRRKYGPNKNQSLQCWLISALDPA